MIQWTLGFEDDDLLPLYHVEGGLNIADILTKEHPVTTCFHGVAVGGWPGHDWMRGPVDAMPIRGYDLIYIKQEDEALVQSEC